MQRRIKRVVGGGFRQTDRETDRRTDGQTAAAAGGGVGRIEKRFIQSYNSQRATGHPGFVRRALPNSAESRAARADDSAAPPPRHPPAGTLVQCSSARQEYAVRSQAATLAVQCGADKKLTHYGKVVSSSFWGLTVNPDRPRTEKPKPRSRGNSTQKPKVKKIILEVILTPIPK